MKELKDHYFSQKAFDHFKYDNWVEEETVCEVSINGEWKLFTEQIAVGKEPTSKAWGDLVFVGSSNVRRYSKFSDWLKQLRLQKFESVAKE